ncbi:MAG: G1 family glutamic endopeptidase [Sulfobacillus sp.]
MRRIACGFGSLALLLATGAGPVASSAAPAISHAPRIALAVPGTTHGHGGSSATTSPFGWASSNWSGYALATSVSGTYTQITGSWIVPTVAPSRGSTYSSSWIGIDGFNNSNLIQTGTEQDYYQGSAHYDAWWEILPAAETVITGDPVNPGDAMTASVAKNANGTWTIAISDVTAGWSFSTTQTYTGPGTSAEWIQEAPTIGGHVATLANYSPTTFDPGTVNGVNPGLVAADGGVMIQKRTQVSTPSLPDPDTDGFAVQYGSSIPAAPGS